MALQSALEKAVVSQNSIPMHDGTVPHLQSIHLVDIVMEEEMFLKGSEIGIQATEVTLSAHHKDGTEALPGTETGRVEVGALLVPQVLTVVVMGTAGGALDTVLAM